MATVSISKSSINVVGGGSANATGGAAATFGTASNEYALIAGIASSVPTTVTIATATGNFVFTIPGTFTLYPGGLCIPPSTTVTVAGDGGASVAEILYTKFANT